MTIKKVERLNKTSYTVRYDLGLNEDGKRIQKVMSGFKTLEEAVEFQNTLEKEKLVIKKDPKKLSEPKAKKHYTPKTWNAHEIDQFLELANKTHYGLLYELTLDTGLRAGEVAALTWTDVNFEKKTLSVNKTVIKRYDGKFTQKPIIRKRTIPLPDQTIKKLAIHKNRQKQLKSKFGEYYQNEYNLVFTNRRGRVINPNLLQSHFKSLVKKAGVSEITFHCLRHTHARLSLQAGVRIDVLSHILGHYDIENTLEIYSHFLNAKDQD